MSALTPSVKPAPEFNAQDDCEILRKAMKGAGTDEDAIIGVLCHRSWQQRTEIEKAYKQMFGKDLEKEIKSETSGDFYKVLMRLLKTPNELAAFELHEAISGAGTDESCLVETICTRTNDELKEIAETYKKREFFQQYFVHLKSPYIIVYGKTLESDVEGDTSGYFRRLLVSLLTCNRPEGSNVDAAAATSDAEVLFKAGQDQVGTDEAEFNKILCSRSYIQLQATFDAYSKKYSKEIVDVIKSEFSGDFRKALLAVVGAIRSRAAYFADCLHDAMAGAGTNDRKLIRIVVGRADFDLEAIKTEYQRLFGKPLVRAIRSETSGDYRKALIALCGGEA